VAELVDARDLKSLVPHGTCRFDSGPPHQIRNGLVNNQDFELGLSPELRQTVKTLPPVRWDSIVP
jgi:hypothetical protein